MPETLTLERASVPSLRQISGDVLNLWGSPLDSVEIVIEGTGQRATTTADGRFALSLTPEARVGRFALPGRDTMYVDLRTPGAYIVELSSRPTDRDPAVRIGPNRITQVPLPPPAPRFEAFDAYLATDAGDAFDAPIELVISINGRGRASVTRLGPSYDTQRGDLRKARALVAGGPDWPEAYRRKQWRYTVE